MSRARTVIALGAGAVVVALAGVAPLILSPTKPAMSGAVANSVSSFSTAHPEWAILRDGPREDATPLRLNHAVHLNAAPKDMQDRLLALLASKGGSSPGVAADSEGRLSLTCGACHVPDDTGRYMKPIAFDAHCAACHADDLGRVNVAPGAVEPEAAPHGDVARIAALIDRKNLERIALERAAPPAQGAPPADPPQGGAAPAAQAEPSPAASNRPGARRPGGAKPAPGASGAAPIPAFTSKDDATRWLAQERSAALQRIQTGCTKCHAGVQDAPADPPGATFVVTPPRIPDRWLPRSVFDHAAHSMLTCIACHTKTPTSEATADILIPGIDSCRACHGAQGSTAGVTLSLGWGKTERHAPGSCVTCHLYHDRTAPSGTGSLSAPDFFDRAVVKPAGTDAPSAAPKPDAPK